ncbi:MAG: hypothetical protein AAB410_01590 [Patescibacteria group bacterium]
MKDRMFMATIILVSVLAGMLLMFSIDSFKNQEEVGAAEGGLIQVKKNQ